MAFEPASFTAPKHQVMTLRRTDVFDQKVPDYESSQYDLYVPVDFNDMFQYVPRNALAVVHDFKDGVEDETIVANFVGKYAKYIDLSCILLHSDVKSAAAFAARQLGPAEAKVSIRNYTADVLELARALRDASYGVSVVNQHSDTLDNANNFVSGVSTAYANSKFVKVSRAALNKAHDDDMPTGNLLGNSTKLREAVESVFRNDGFTSGAVQQLFLPAKVKAKVLGVLTVESEPTSDGTIQGRLFDIGVGISPTDSVDLARIVNYYENIPTRGTDYYSGDDADTVSQRRKGAQILMKLGADFCAVYDSLAGHANMIQWLEDESKMWNAISNDTVNQPGTRTTLISANDSVFGARLIGFYGLRLLYFAQHWLQTPITQNFVNPTPGLTAAPNLLVSGTGTLDIAQLYIGFKIKFTSDVANISFSGQMEEASPHMFAPSAWKLFPNGFAASSTGGVDAKAFDFIHYTYTSDNIQRSKVTVADVNSNLDCPYVVQQRWAFVVDDEIVQRYLLLSNTETSGAIERKAVSLSVRFRHTPTAIATAAPALKVSRSSGLDIGTYTAGAAAAAWESTASNSDQLYGLALTVDGSVVWSLNEPTNGISIAGSNVTIAAGAMAQKVFTIRATLITGKEFDYTFSISRTYLPPLLELSLGVVVTRHAAFSVTNATAVAWSSQASSSEETYGLSLVSMQRTVTWSLVDAVGADVNITNATITIAAGAQQPATFKIRATIDGTQTIDYYFSFSREYQSPQLTLSRAGQSTTTVGANNTTAVPWDTLAYPSAVTYALSLVNVSTDVDWALVDIADSPSTFTGISIAGSTVTIATGAHPNATFKIRAIIDGVQSIYYKFSFGSAYPTPKLALSHAGIVTQHPAANQVPVVLDSAPSASAETYALSLNTYSNPAYSGVTTWKLLGEVTGVTLASTTITIAAGIFGSVTDPRDFTIRATVGTTQIFDFNFSVYRAYPIDTPLTLTHNAQPLATTYSAANVQAAAWPGGGQPSDEAQDYALTLPAVLLGVLDTLSWSLSPNVAKVSLADNTVTIEAGAIATAEFSISAVVAGPIGTQTFVYSFYVGRAYPPQSVTFALQGESRPILGAYASNASVSAVVWPYSSASEQESYQLALTPSTVGDLDVLGATEWSLQTLTGATWSTPGNDIGVSIAGSMVTINAGAMTQKSFRIRAAVDSTAQMFYYYFSISRQYPPQALKFTNVENANDKTINDASNRMAWNPVAYVEAQTYQLAFSESDVPNTVWSLVTDADATVPGVSIDTVNGRITIAAGIYNSAASAKNFSIRASIDSGAQEFEYKFSFYRAYPPQTVYAYDDEEYFFSGAVGATVNWSSDALNADQTYELSLGDEFALFTGHTIAWSLANASNSGASIAGTNSGTNLTMAAGAWPSTTFQIVATITRTSGGDTQVFSYTIQSTRMYSDLQLRFTQSVVGGEAFTVGAQSVNNTSASQWEPMASASDEVYDMQLLAGPVNVGSSRTTVWYIVDELGASMEVPGVFVQNTEVSEVPTITIAPGETVASAANPTPFMLRGLVDNLQTFDYKFSFYRKYPKLTIGNSIGPIDAANVVAVDLDPVASASNTTYTLALNVEGNIVWSLVPAVVAGVSIVNSGMGVMLGIAGGAWAPSTFTIRAKITPSISGISTDYDYKVSFSRKYPPQMLALSGVNGKQVFAPDAAVVAWPSSTSASVEAYGLSLQNAAGVSTVPVHDMTWSAVAGGGASITGSTILIPAGDIGDSAHPESLVITVVIDNFQTFAYNLTFYRASLSPT